MKSLTLAPEALGDLADIRAYTVRVWGLGQAERYLGEMGSEFRKIASGDAVSRAAGLRDFRKLRFRSHMIYFRELPDTVSVIRVLHVSMDAERHLN